ncbi:MAG: hypothetical protein ACOCP4_07450 [Candidatus Woesearchaeota archaeon]
MKIPGLGRLKWKTDKEGMIFGFLLSFLITVIPFTRFIYDKIVYMLQQRKLPEELRDDYDYADVAQVFKDHDRKGFGEITVEKSSTGNKMISSGDSAYSLSYMDDLIAMREGKKSNSNSSLTI